MATQNDLAHLWRVVDEDGNVWWIDRDEDPVEAFGPDAAFAPFVATVEADAP